MIKQGLFIEYIYLIIPNDDLKSVVLTKQCKITTKPVVVLGLNRRLNKSLFIALEYVTS